MIRYDQPYLDKLKVMEALQTYSAPKSKLTRLLKDETLLRIRRGLYLPPDAAYSLKTLANMIYGPSYISFEYALSGYGIIPERVLNITSAAYGKNKHKRFDTPLGTYLYRTIPSAVFHLGIRRFEEDGSPYLIATVEKAICDTLYLHRRVQSLKDLRELLFDDLRFDRSALRDLDLNAISTLAPLYGKRILVQFTRLIQGELS